jgi:hypothetical protein
MHSIRDDARVRVQAFPEEDSGLIMLEPIERPKIEFKSSPLPWLWVALSLISTVMLFLHHDRIAFASQIAALATLIVILYRRPSFPSWKR